MDSPSVAITGVRLIDGSGAPPVEDVTILLTGNRIVAVGPRAGVQVPTGGRSWDAGGRTVVPGLIDLHMHSIEPANHRRYVEHGVTSVRFAGGDQAEIVNLRDQIERRALLGPRIFSCGPLVDQYPSTYPHHSLELHDAEDARRKIPQLIDEEHVDAIIVTQRVTPAVVEAVVNAAHERSIPVTGQTWVTSGREAAELGIDGLENTSRLPENPAVPLEQLLQTSSVPDRLAALCRLWTTAPESNLMSVLESMARHQVTWTPTLVVFEYFARSTEADAELAPTLRIADEAEVADWHRLREVFAGNWGPAEIEMAFRAIDRIEASLASYHAMGGPIAAGSDLTFGGPSLIREVRLLTQAGLSPLEAIRAATGVAGSALGRGSELGILQPGSFADLVVLEDDPLSDLSALGRPSTVMIDGRVVLGELGNAGRKLDIDRVWVNGSPCRRRS